MPVSSCARRRRRRRGKRPCGRRRPPKPRTAVRRRARREAAATATPSTQRGSPMEPAAWTFQMQRVRRQLPPTVPLSPMEMRGCDHRPDCAACFGARRTPSCTAVGGGSSSGPRRSSSSNTSRPHHGRSYNLLLGGSVPRGQQGEVYAHHAPRRRCLPRTLPRSRRRCAGVWPPLLGGCHRPRSCSRLRRRLRRRSRLRNTNRGYCPRLCPHQSWLLPLRWRAEALRNLLHGQ